MKTLHVFVVICIVKYVSAWDNDDLELFDLVEEINSNFYEEFGVKNDAGVSEIKKSYRKLSLQYHPDKNKEEGAELKFRQLVAMYEILKDEERRKKYDHVLEFGLPDWRQPVYYYRKVKKLGLLEMTVILFFIFTVGHFLVMWAAYYEKKFEMEEVFNSRKKKDKKGRKAKLQQAQIDEEMEEELQRQLDSITRPRGWDLLPFKLSRGIYNGLVSLPGRLRALQEEREQRRQQQRLQEELQREMEEEAKMEKEKRPKRKRIQVYYETDPNEVTEKPVSYTPTLNTEESDESQPQNTDEWTSDDFALLAKAVAKYPGGTSNRWDKIATMLNRDVSEVIIKSKQVKTDFNKPVETAAQGITGIIGESVQIKKGQTISNDISQRSDFVEDYSNSTVNKTTKQSPARGNKKMTERTLKASEETKNVSNNVMNGAASESSPLVKNNSRIRDNDISSKVNKSTIQKRVSFSSENQSTTSEALSKSMKEKCGKLSVDGGDCVGDTWTQNQQKIFEWSLTQYPRGVEERWDKIAKHIPGKSKDECIVRFKYLAEEGYGNCQKGSGEIHKLSTELRRDKELSTEFWRNTGIVHRVQKVCRNCPQGSGGM